MYTLSYVITNRLLNLDCTYIHFVITGDYENDDILYIIFLSYGFNITGFKLNIAWNVQILNK